MKRLVFIIAIVGIAAIAGGLLLLSRSPKKGAAPTSSLPTRPWLEVATPTISIAAAGTSRTLRSGDELDDGATLITDAIGSAIIHFPDGSIARLDPGSTLTITAVTYREDDGTLVARLRLATGRVWSKVFELATPQSLWEVKTSNAVATVRGTAFGVAVAADRTQIAGSEDQISVAVVDPRTDSIIPGTEVKIAAEDYTEVSPREAAAAVKPDVRRADEAPPELQVWRVENRSKDEEVNRAIQAIEATGASPNEVRRIIREELQEKLDAIREATPGTPGEKSSDAEPAADDAATEPPGTPPQASETPAAEAGVVAKPTAVTVKVSRTLDRIVEGENVTLTATLGFTDGTSRDVTDEVAWRVLGPIGTISRQGTFTARLDPTVSELGRSSGSIAATWKDPKSGETFLGATPIFSVEAKIEVVAPQG